MALSHPVQPAPWGEYVPNTDIMTLAQYEPLPDVDGWIFELFQGRMLRTPGPDGIHGLIHARLLGILGNQLFAMNHRHCYGMVCCALPHWEDTVLCPDFAFVAPHRLITKTTFMGYLTLAPDWVIEIASPSDYRPQMQQKMQVYLTAGVRLAWVIWPNSQTVDIWRPGDTTLPSRIATPADTLDGADVAPGLSLTMAELFDF